MKNKNRMLIFFHIEIQLFDFYIRPYDLRNPYLAPVLASRELFQKDCARSCLHLELDIANARIK